jgi:hypothetical protein
MDINSILNDLRAQRDKLTNAINALEGSVGNGRRRRRLGPVLAVAGRRPRRHLSPAARAKIARAAKARWAKAKAQGKNRL